MIIQKFSRKDLRKGKAVPMNQKDPAQQHKQEKKAPDISQMLDDLITDYHIPERQMIEEISNLLSHAILEDYHDHEMDVCQIHRLFGELRLDLEQHFAKEEAQIFPSMKANLHPDDDTIIKVMDLENEHSQAEEKIADIQQRTAFLEPPAGCSEDLEEAYNQIDRLFEHLAQHVALENNVVFQAYEDLR